jgi:hypothetical protein
MGTSYTFKVLARNAYGESAYSTELQVLAAQIPDPPSTPVTSVQGLGVLVDWDIISTGGSAILGYRIYIQQADAISFSTEPLDCDGSSPQVV